MWCGAWCIRMHVQKRHLPSYHARTPMLPPPSACPQVYDGLLLEGQLGEYEAAFRAVDKSGNGTIGANELGQLFAKLGSPMSLEKLVEVMQVRSDQQGCGWIVVGLVGSRGHGRVWRRVSDGKAWGEDREPIKRSSNAKARR